MASTVRIGSTGSDVSRLQDFLYHMGYYLSVSSCPQDPILETCPKSACACDGYFGQRTAEALKMFQREYGLVADGIAGPQTWDMIQRVIACYRAHGIPVTQWHKAHPDLKPGGAGCLRFAPPPMGIPEGPLPPGDGAQTPVTPPTTQKPPLPYGLPTLRIGVKHKMVCVLKETLSGLGFYGGQIDDCFDDRTRKAVIAFQQGYGLAVDGIVGPKTWAKIWEIRSDGIPTEVSCREASACAVVLPPPINIGDGGSPPVTTAPGAKPTLGKDGLYLIGGLLIIIGVLEMFKQGES